MPIPPCFPKDEIVRNINETVDKVCKDLRDFAEYLRQKQCENEYNEQQSGGLKMDTKELFDLIKARKRMCDTIKCSDCPLLFAGCNLNMIEVIEDIERLIRTVKEWDAAHPALEEVGKGIYYDPKHRIVPDEITRVYTLEVTFVDKGGRVLDEEKMKELRKVVVPQWLDGAFPAADDAKCVKVQQFVTKCHEEDI